MLTWIGTRCARVSKAVVGAQAGWTSVIDAVEEELVDAFLIAPDQARLFCGRSQGQTLVWRACNRPWCDKQSWRRKARICKHILTARQRLDESLLGERRTDPTRTVGLVHELLVLARQAHKLAAFPVSLILCARRQSFWKHRLRTIATLLDWMITHHESGSVWSGRPGLAPAAAGSAQIMARMAGGEHDRRCSECAPARTGTNRVPSLA